MCSRVGSSASLKDRMLREKQVRGEYCGFGSGHVQLELPLRIPDGNIKSRAGSGDKVRGKAIGKARVT